MKTLYKYELDYGRHGTLEGLFIAQPSDLEKLKGKTAYFGEVLGKHSDVYDENPFDNLTFVTDDEKVMELIEKYNLEFGYNPFHCIEEA